MTTQEIFQNMTKGEWQPAINEPFKNFSILSTTAFAIARVDGESLMERKANLTAIADAVNNTFGKGINPESVGDVNEKAEYLIKKINEAAISRGRRDVVILYDSIAFALGQLKEALTAAKLDNNG